MNRRITLDTYPNLARMADALDTEEEVQAFIDGGWEKVF